MKHTFQTIDFAERFGAGVVVLHMGRTPIDDYTSKLVKMAEVGLIHSREYVREKLACIRKREDKAAPYLQRSKECLTRIVEYRPGARA